MNGGLLLYALGDNNYNNQYTYDAFWVDVAGLLGPKALTTVRLTKRVIRVRRGDMLTEDGCNVM
jgi:hypothetical protein